MVRRVKVFLMFAGICCCNDDGMTSIQLHTNSCPLGAIVFGLKESMAETRADDCSCCFTVSDFLPSQSRLFLFLHSTGGLSFGCF